MTATKSMNVCGGYWSFDEDTASVQTAVWEQKTPVGDAVDGYEAKVCLIFFGKKSGRKLYIPYTI